MKTFKIITLGALSMAVFLSAGCGNLGDRPTKPQAITVDGIDIEKGRDGRLVVSRNGERFKRCEKDCNILTKPVQVDSIKTQSKGLGCSTAVTLIGYQVPVEPLEQSPEKVGKPAVNIDPTKRVNPDITKAKLLKTSAVDRKEIATTEPQQLFPLAFSHWLCRPVRSITERNGCCSYYLATDPSGSKMVLPVSEDPDCNR